MRFSIKSFHYQSLGQRRNCSVRLASVVPPIDPQVTAPRSLISRKLEMPAMEKTPSQPLRDERN